MRMVHFYHHLVIILISILVGVFGLSLMLTNDTYASLDEHKIDEEDRFKISPIDAQPYIMVVFIRVYWEEADVSAGTGFFVGPNTIATAAHVIYNPERAPLEDIKLLLATKAGDFDFF